MQTKFPLDREAFGRLVRGEVIELRPDVSIALSDIGFEGMLAEIDEAAKARRPHDVLESWRPTRRQP